MARSPASQELARDVFANFVAYLETDPLLWDKPRTDVQSIAYEMASVYRESSSTEQALDVARQCLRELRRGR